jgi:hypothetical protein
MSFGCSKAVGLGRLTWKDREPSISHPGALLTATQNDLRSYQKAAIQAVERAMLFVAPMKPASDKRVRLQVVVPYIKNDSVLFPRNGCEQLGPSHMSGYATYRGVGSA